MDRPRHGLNSPALTIQRFNDSRGESLIIFANLDEQRRHSTTVRQSPTTVQSFFCF